ncbi:hypothetical protein ACT8ZV_13790 [Nocardioides sp. MAHUQ-72]|uniref:hypothetical protein n=1 Tax=unclassified Nocardioides TaxID=2615069 RepID=UPI003606A0AD
MTSRDRAGATRAGSASIALALAALLLTGCTGSQDSAAGESGRPPSSATGSPQSGPPTPSVPPASGKAVDTSYFTAHVPRGFTVDVTAEDFSIYTYDPGGRTEISFGITPTYGKQPTLDQLAHSTLRHGLWERDPRIADETTLAGEPAYHLTGPVGLGRHTETYGAAYRDRHIDVTIDSVLPVPELRRLADSVLASWQWK